jgi:Lung seven transmembrane receptor
MVYESLPIQVALDLAVLMMMGASFVDVVFAGLIFHAINSTITQLKAKRQEDRIQLYKRFG